MCRTSTKLAVLLLVGAQSATACEICTDLETINKAALDGFSAELRLPKPMRAEACRMVHNQNASQAYRCSWSFPLRSDEASEMFDKMVSILEQCLPGLKHLGSDKPVNHPDSYLLWEYSLDERRITVSLKDKAALGKTFFAFTMFGGS